MLHDICELFTVELTNVCVISLQRVEGTNETVCVDQNLDCSVRPM